MPVIDPDIERIYRAVLDAEREKAAARARFFLPSEPVQVHPKQSALMQRLLHGKQPLVMPPPKVDNVPWYAVIEADGPLEIASLSMRPSRPGQQVLINGDGWLVTRVLSRDCVQVTYPGWQAMGFEWRLECCSIDSEKSGFGIIFDGRKAHTEKEVNQLIEEVCAARTTSEDQALGRSQVAMRESLLERVLQQSPIGVGFEFVNGRVFVRRWQIERIAPDTLADSVFWVPPWV